MCIPKTNRLFRRLVQKDDNASPHRKDPVVASFRAPRKPSHALAGACALLSTLAVAPLQGNAAQLSVSTLAGPESVSLIAARNVSMIAEPYGGDAASAGSHPRLNLDNGLLEAGISDFEAGARRQAANSGEPRVTEFSSLGISGVTPFSIPLQAADGLDNTPFGGPGSAAAGMPMVMVLVWLIGIGLIGMGTVGRRKQTKP